MKTQTTLLFILVSMLILSCKKDKKSAENPTPAPTTTVEPKPIDTIKPSSPYFPAFPGSWWKYKHFKNGNIVSTNDTIIYKTSSTYQKDSYGYYDNRVPPKYISGSAYVSFYRDKPVWGDKTKVTFISGSTLVPLVSETLSVGSEWITRYQSHFVDASKIEKKDLTYAVNGTTYSSVIVVAHFSYYDGNSSFKPVNKREYFAKDVGLIAEKGYYPGLSDSLWYEIHLVDHHIGNH